MTEARFPFLSFRVGALFVPSLSLSVTYTLVDFINEGSEKGKRNEKDGKEAQCVPTVNYSFTSLSVDMEKLNSA